MRRALDMETIRLAAGAHDANQEEMCVMEAVAYVAGEAWTDAPQCASPVIAAFCRAWNDAPEPYGQAIRDRLRGYIPRLIGSRGTSEQEERRAWLAMDWLIRVHTPSWLRLAGLSAHADALAALPPQTSRDAMLDRDATDAAVWAAARAAWDAAARAARAATDDAARAAAWDAAWDAAWERLRPVVGQIQESAWALLDAMLAVGSEAE